jgi:hypothetical protein
MNPMSISHKQKKNMRTFKQQNAHFHLYSSKIILSDKMCAVEQRKSQVITTFCTLLLFEIEETNMSQELHINYASWLPCSDI